MSNSFAGPLHIFALQGNLEDLKRALNDPVYYDSLVTPVTNEFAVFLEDSNEKNKKVVEEVHVDMLDDEGWTPLMHAVIGGQAHIVQYLVDQGADVDIQNYEKKQNALMLASAFSHENIVEILLEAGGDLEEKDIYGWTALTHASFNGHAYTAYQLIMKGAKIDVLANDSWTPLMISARIGHDEVVKLLLQAGADKNMKNSKGWTPIMIATSANHIAVVNLLIEFGADIYQIDKNGDTAISLAQKANYPNITQLLQEYAAATPLL